MRPLPGYGMRRLAIFLYTYTLHDCTRFSRQNDSNENVVKRMTRPVKDNRWVPWLLAGVWGWALGATTLTLPAAPAVVTNTQPVTAVDVVGSELKFTATFNSA